jgi:competence protein ComEA
VPSVSISRSTALVLASLLLAAFVVVGPRLAGTGAASVPEAAAPLEIDAAPPSNRVVVIHVVGAVRRPGLLRLPEGSRVADAVRRAGGASRRADLAALNLAAPLADGAQVLVPLRSLPGARAPAGAAGSAGPSEGPATRPSLSSATVEQLDELPGVGPVTAQRIVEYRTAHGPFGSVDDLDAVPGIGPARLEQLRDLVTP